MIQTLSVYLNEDLAGTLTRDTTTSELSFCYDPFYTDKPEAIALSVSMPFGKEPFDDVTTESFFSNLLPDFEIRNKLARALGHAESNTFALLRDIGRDCAGAISLYLPEQSPANAPEPPELLTETRLQELLEIMKVRPLLANYDNVRLSLAGAQSKIAVGMTDERQPVLMKDGQPTSHILKPVIELPGIADSVQNEFFCMSLAKESGLNAPSVDMRFFAGIPCYLIERYDRKRENGKLVRLHQEDFCQALSVYPVNKYEVDNGPSISSCFDVLERYSADPLTDKTTFFYHIFFNFMIGNADAHGKNHSLLHDLPRQKVRLAPIYDVMSTEIYPLNNSPAMRINGKESYDDVTLDDFLSIIATTKTGRSYFKKKLRKFGENLLKVAEKKTLRLNKSDFKSPVYEKICSVAEKRFKQLFS